MRVWRVLLGCLWCGLQPSLSTMRMTTRESSTVESSGMAPSVICWPLEHGADLVLHSATKFLGGCLAPNEVFLLRRGLETVALTTPLSRRPE
ncbi:MAG: PLP-dependent transferase [Pseudonocardiaceae bacterium]